MSTDNTANEPETDDETSSVEAHAVTEGPSGVDPVEPAEVEAAAPAEEAPVEITSIEAAPATGEIVLEDDDREDVEDRDDDDDHGDDKKSAKEETIEIAKTIFYALLIALVLRVLLFQPFTIPSASMEPNLYEGDYIIVSKWDYGYSRHSIPLSPGIFHGRLFGSQPQRGDIAVFKLPRDNKTDYIKRVIGLPGDRIQMRNNLLYINDKPVTDVIRGPISVDTGGGLERTATAITETLPGGKQITIQDFSAEGYLDNTGVYTVPPGHYFMMGDNRDNSIDSRVAADQNGVDLVPAENLVGKANIILFSWKPGASLWKPWTWFTHLRPSRFFHVLK